MYKKIKESELEKELVLRIKRLGGRAYKWVSPGNVGVPDRIVLLPGGIVYFVELKAEGGRLSPLQEVQMRRLSTLGQDVCEVVGAGGLVGFLEHIGYGEEARAVKNKYWVDASGV